MAGGPASVSVPKVVAAESRPERAPILHPRMAALIVLANRFKYATRETVLEVQVRIVVLTTCLVAIGSLHRFGLLVIL